MASRLVYIVTAYVPGEDDIAFTRACVAECLEEGLIPLAPHLLYTQVQEERHREADLAMMRLADVARVYTGRGLSADMREDITAASAEGVAIEWRETPHSAGGWPRHYPPVVTAGDTASGAALREGLQVLANDEGAQRAFSNAESLTDFLAWFALRMERAAMTIEARGRFYDAWSDAD